MLGPMFLFEGQNLNIVWNKYYRDAVVMGVESGAWREVGDMWGNEERVRVGKIVVVEYNGCPMIFMLDGNEILRYFL